MIEMCQPCKEKGRLKMPHFTFHGVQMCGDCHTEALEKEKAQPKPEPDFSGIYANTPKEESMPTSIPIDWSKVQEQRDNGATIVALAVKYKVSHATICNHTKPRAKPNGEAQERFRQPKPAPAPDKGLSLALILEDLRLEREQLDLVISLLEKRVR